MDKSKLVVLDTTLRDGEQSPGCSMGVESKLLIARQLASLGVDIVEAGFPVVSPGDFEAVQRISQEFSASGPVVCALARTRKEDIEAAAKALSPALRRRIHVFIATSDVHMEKKLMKSPEQILQMVAENVRLAKSLVDDVQFSPEDSSRTGFEFLMQVIDAAVSNGATTINIPDTVGYSVGSEFGKLIASVCSDLYHRYPNVVVSVHCHNDLGMAVANTLVGVEAGARQVECCVMGIGERAGNAQLEAVVMAVKTRSDYYSVWTSIDTTRLCEAARVLSSVIGKQIPDTLPVVGGNVFSHGGGIHQDGMQKDRRTYEIMRPEDVGWKGESSPLVKHSGRANLKSRLSSLGYSFDSSLLERIYQKFLALADHKTFVYNDDIHLLMQECLVEATVEKEKLVRVVRVDYHRVDKALSATVTLSQNGRVFEASGSGDGPVASIADAISKVLLRMDYPVPFLAWEGYSVSQSTGGVESVGLVGIRAKTGKGIGYGRGSDTDVMFATAKAMVSAFNHLMQAPVREENENGS